MGRQKSTVLGCLLALSHIGTDQDVRTPTQASRLSTISTGFVRTGPS